MAYPTAAVLVAESNVPALTGLDSAQQEELRQAAIAALEEFCQQGFEADEDATEVLDGTGSAVVWLPRRLEELTAISVRGTALGLPDVVLGADGTRVVIKQVVGNYAVRAMMDDSDLRREFPTEPNAIEITGTWGWTVCPENIVTALRLDMEDNALADTHALSQTIRASRALGLRSIGQGNLRAAIEGAPGLSPRVMRLLNRYVWTPGLGSLV